MIETEKVLMCSIDDRDDGQSNPPVSDPSEWTTGSDPPSDKQRALLATLSKETGADVPGLSETSNDPQDGLTKAQASEKISELIDMKADSDVKQGTGSTRAMDNEKDGRGQGVAVGTGGNYGEQPGLDTGGGPKDGQSNNEDHLSHPENWATGGEPATAKQKGFLSTLAAQKGVQVDPSGISKSDASAQIDELKKMSGNAV